MKYYSMEKIRDFVAKSEKPIKSVSVGMKEDWGWTAVEIYRKGKFTANVNGKRLKVAGIEGSTWATPVMRVEYKGGILETIECYDDDGFVEDTEMIAQQMGYAALTGGMDSVPE
jgi:hypothetical protein